MQPMIEVSGDRTATLTRLRGAIDALATAGNGGGNAPQNALPTGWSGIDSLLPGGGLSRGALHEWFGVMGSSHQAPEKTRSLAHWIPPVSVLMHLAARMCGPSHRDSTAPPPVIVWIGRRVWPYGHALQHISTGIFDASICVDARSADQRFWALDVALRTPGVAVVADASAMPLAVSRRLQLAAEESARDGGVLALLARPPWEESELSVASTRWRVRSALATADAPRWTIELARCKGSQAYASHAEPWTVERGDHGQLFSVPSQLADRSTPAARAS